VGIIKLFFISLVFLFLLGTGISLMIPSHIRISKAINLHAPKDTIFSLVKNPERWKEWHPAFMESPGRKSFDTIIVSDILQQGDTVTMLLRQGKKEPVANGWKIYEHSDVDSLTLQWYMDFRLKWYPWKKFSSLFFENTYGVMMQEGLTNLKKITTQ
jgi:ribosome-associated toxin RatA of RatAB toxin-antitoxin module